MTASRYYPNLPGVQTTLLDGNLYSTSIARSDNVTILGTAQDGPKFMPMQMLRPGAAGLTYGDLTIEAPCNIVKSLHQLTNAGGDTLVGCRLTGQYAETVLVETDEDTNNIATVVLDDIDIDDTSTQYSLTTTVVYPGAVTDNVQVNWLAHVEIDTINSTATLAIAGKGEASTDAAEAGSTGTIIQATGHSVVAGDVVTFTSGILDGETGTVLSANADDFTMTTATAFPAAPATGDTFSFYTPVHILVDEWIEGQHYWINYHNGAIEFPSAPYDSATTPDATLKFTSCTKVNYSIRLRSVFPGSLYNTSYTTSETNASHLVTVTDSGASGGTIRITKPAGKGTGYIEVDYDADDTNYEVAELINNATGNTFVQAYIDGNFRDINALATNNSTPATDTAVGTSAPWNTNFLSMTSSGDPPTPTTNAASNLWETSIATYRRFHYGAAEEYSIENIPGVSGRPAPITNGTSTVTVGSDILTQGAGPVNHYLPYYYSAHSTLTLKQDLYNSLLSYGEYYVECYPDENGKYYVEGGIYDGRPTNIVLKVTKATEGAFDWLEKIDISWLVPKNMWADDIIYKYDSDWVTTAPTVATAPNVTFAEEFSVFAKSCWERGSHTMVSMAYTPVASPDLLSVSAHVTDVIAHQATISYAAVSGITGTALDSGRFLCLLPGPDVKVRMPGAGNVHTTPEALFAATVAGMPPGQGPTNQPLNGALGLRYRFTQQQLDDLTDNHLIALKASAMGTAERIRIVDGVTQAADIAVGQPSDFTRVRTMRIVTTAVNAIRNAAEPWIGQGNSRPMRQSLATEISKVLSGMKDNTTLNGYAFSISSTNSGYQNDTLNIDLTLIPSGEVRHITITVSVTR